MCYLPTGPLLFLQKTHQRPYILYMLYWTNIHSSIIFPKNHHGHHSILSVLSPMDHFWRAFVFAFMTPTLQRWQLMPCELCLQYVADAKRIARSSFKTGVSTFHFFLFARWLDVSGHEVWMHHTDPLTHYTTSKAMTCLKQNDISTHVLDAISLYVYTHRHSPGSPEMRKTWTYRHIISLSLYI